VTQVGFKPTLIGGLIILAVGLFWFSRISQTGSYLSDVLGPSILAGCGLGFTVAARRAEAATVPA
jgi:fucose permease